MGLPESFGVMLVVGYLLVATLAVTPLFFLVSWRLESRGAPTAIHIAWFVGLWLAGVGGFALAVSASGGEQAWTRGILLYGGLALIAVAGTARCR